MANIKRRANSQPSRGKVFPQNGIQLEKSVAPVQLVYFDPDDLRQLQKLDAELTVEILENTGSKSKLSSFYEFLIK